ncbi:MAG: ATP synthase subunit F [Lachnospiraceae bacterium]|nr:ATP synthase subunit F [Lachnospiraceae bacterium]
MKMYLISDNRDTYTGMRLTGVEGVIVHERQELKEALEQAFEDREIGIVLLTEKFGREFPDIIDDVRLNRRLPLLIEIPDRHGTGRKENFITAYVSEAIGLKL